jgi:hypothetical protein
MLETISVYEYRMAYLYQFEDYDSEDDSDYVPSDQEDESDDSDESLDEDDLDSDIEEVKLKHLVPTHVRIKKGQQYLKNA